VSRPLTLPEAAEHLRKSKRWLLEWVRKHPADKAGEPYFTPAGRDKLFHQADISRIELALDLERRRVTFIYFVEMQGHIKIGIAANWRKRINSLQTSSPFPVRRLLVIRSGVGMEPILHEKLAPLRVRGEWFRDCPEIREFIAKAAALGLTEAGEEQ
jgi:hypothetical protein